MAAAVISASMLFGCAKPAGTTAAATTAAAADTEAAADETKEETAATPFLSDLEKYDSVISELKEGQYYAFTDICKDYDVLFVADNAFDNGKGEMESESARLYGLDKDASEEFDKNGAAKYFYFDLDNKFEGEVEDDTQFTAMLEDYGKATVINFTEVGAAR